VSKTPKATGYTDEDLAQVNQRLDDAEKKRDDAILKAKDAYKRTIKVIEAEAKQVNILMRPLKAARKVQRLEREIEAATARVKDDEIEVFTDMLGQMSFLPPTGDETPGEAAARKRSEKIAETTASEQIEGAAVLDGLGGQPEAVH
jgi:hypothetical protein